MLKKILTLSLVAVLLSVSVFANPYAIDAQAEFNYDAVITVASQDDAVIDETTGLGGTVTLAVTSDKAYENAIVVTAVFDGTTFLTASITDVALELGANEEIITLPEALSDTNDSYDVKFFLWESKATLEPLAAPFPIEVVPAQPSIAYWDGVTETQPQTTDIAGVTYYQISNGAELAWFSKNAGLTANAILTDDIYLNNDDSTSNNWYEYHIGISTNCYSGTFDGNGNKIYNLYIEGDSDAGFFGGTKGAIIKDVTFENAKLISTASAKTTNNVFAAIVSAYAYNSLFENVDIVNGYMAPKSGDHRLVCAGPIAGVVYSDYATTTEEYIPASRTSTKIVNCDVVADIDLSMYANVVAAYTGDSNAGVGGIVGCLGKGSKTSKRLTEITSCTFTGEINAPNSYLIGGVVGRETRGVNLLINGTTLTGLMTAYAESTHAGTTHKNSTVNPYSHKIVGSTQDSTSIVYDGNAKANNTTNFTVTYASEAAAE